MKIKEECIRDVLMSIEDTVTCYESFHYIAADPAPKRLEKYSHDEIVYHIRHCNQLGYLTGCSFLGNGAMIFVEDLSTGGHEYLRNVRSNSTWGQIKQVLVSHKNESIKQLAKMVVQTLWQCIKPAWWPT